MRLEIKSRFMSTPQADQKPTFKKRTIQDIIKDPKLLKIGVVIVFEDRKKAEIFQKEQLASNAIGGRFFLYKHDEEDRRIAVFANSIVNGATAEITKISHFLVPKD